MSFFYLILQGILIHSDFLTEIHMTCSTCKLQLFGLACFEDKALGRAGVGMEHGFIRMNIKRGVWGIAERQITDPWFAHRFYSDNTAVLKIKEVLLYYRHVLVSLPQSTSDCSRFSLPLEVFDLHFLGKVVLPALSNSWSENLFIADDPQENG